MQLECAQSINSPNANAEEIELAFADDKGRGEFIVLTQDDGSFTQAAGEFDGPYVIEFSDSKTGKKFTVVGEFTKDQVKLAFLSYLDRSQNVLLKRF